jgi:peptidoglycan/LPS O-acetylase OafA/YrhL
VRLQELDGLRALALSLVILAHHGLLKSGWIGVDIFFVLSGFLITGILRRESKRANYWTWFYTKRLTRLLPPLVLVLSVAVITEGGLQPAYIGYLLFAGNIVQLTPHHIPALGPLWSLAIEEHFYFLWPLAVRFLARTTLLRLSWTIVIMSPVLRLVATLVLRHYGAALTGWDNPIFLLTPFRMDGLAAGAMLALLVEGDRCPGFLARWSGRLIIMAALVFLGLEVALPSFRRTTGSLWFNILGYSLVVAMSFFLVSYLVLRPEARWVRLLASRWTVLLGTISYGFYLYQASVIDLMRHIVSPHSSLKVLFLPDFALTALVAAVSFYWIEKPIIAWGKLILQKQEEGSQAEQVLVPSSTSPLPEGRHF